MADLQEEFPIGGELQHHAVGGLAVPAGPRRVAADPDVALKIDGNAVFARRPLVALARPAPRAHDIALTIELNHRRGGEAAVRGRWFERCGLLISLERP